MIKLEHVDKYFGDLHVLKDVNLEVAEGEKLVIIGPSGSGKSTTVRCMNFLEDFLDDLLHHLLDDLLVRHVEIDAALGADFDAL